MKNCITIILLTAIFSAAITFFITKSSSPDYKVVNKKSDTTTTTTVTIEETENTFSAEQVGNIKKVLIDSLRTVYNGKIKSIISSYKIQTEIESDASEKKYAYVSQLDSFYVALDDSGKVTDSIHVTSTFISPAPIPENSLHLLMIKHKSFTKEISKETTITNTETIVREKTFWDHFIIVPNVSAGIGLINRQFDIYAGVGIGYEL